MAPSRELNLLFVMDPLESINVKKDSTFAMMLAARQRGWNVYMCEPQHMSINNNQVWAQLKQLHILENPNHWHDILDESQRPLDFIDAVFMRKDPPFDMRYIENTYVLEHMENKGCLIVNKPSALRSFNEKVSTTLFPQCTTPLIISANHSELKNFLKIHKDIIVKPLDGMGGAGIFRITHNDPNISVILETLTEHESRLIMAQLYIPEIKKGDKRILLINGKPVPWALARIPKEGETRGNLAAGGTGTAVKLGERDLWICEQLKGFLQQNGIIFAGIDVIGDYLTEINITSPTCIRELNHQCNLDIAADLMSEVESLIQTQ